MERWVGSCLPFRGLGLTHHLRRGVVLDCYQLIGGLVWSCLNLLHHLCQHRQGLSSRHLGRGAKQCGGDNRLLEMS